MYSCSGGKGGKKALRRPRGQPERPPSAQPGAKQKTPRVLRRLPRFAAHPAAIPAPKTIKNPPCFSTVSADAVEKQSGLFHNIRIAVFNLY
jgi:hypothetical protein